MTPEVAEAVRRASEHLGYRPNQIARALRRRSTYTIGMTVPHIANPYFPGVVQAVERSLHAAGRELLLCDSQDDPELEADRVRALVDRQVDGLLMIPCDTRASATTVREAARRLPIVQLDRIVRRVDAPQVRVDDAAGIRAGLDHLRAVGHSELAFVGSRATISTARARLAAYRGSLEAFHPSSARRVLLGEFSVSGGVRQEGDSVPSDGRPTRLCARTT